MSRMSLTQLRCLDVVAVSEAAGAAVLVGVGMAVVVGEVGVAVLAGVGEASASCITSPAHKFAIVLQIPLGNGPDRFNFHSSSIIGAWHHTMQLC